MISRPPVLSTSRLLTLSALTLLCPAAVLAQTASPSYNYGGISAGQSQARLNEAEITQHQLGATTGIANTQTEERDTAYKLFLGHQFNPYLALEGGYFDLGESSFTTDTTAPGSFSGALKTRGWNLDLIGTLPLTSRLSLLGRIGAQHAKTKAEYSGTGLAVPATSSNSESQTNYKYGAGLQYELTPSVLVRGEWERYRVSNLAEGHHNVNVASLSLVFPFGRTMQPAPRQVAAAPYVAPPEAPLPPPVVVVAPAEPVPQRVSFSAESLFGFDQEQIRLEGQRDLDTFTETLKGTQYDTIHITGHTDRLGSSDYNQSLSERRAMAVKSYLVNVRGLDANRITASGLGETQPVTRTENCTGERRTAALVTCLQPDRRVDVDVKGTR